ncbi:MAG: hypothetical protein ACI841_003190 [Planctomycetota bacterium]|jgi:hypothetical protein
MIASPCCSRSWLSTRSIGRRLEAARIALSALVNIEMNRGCQAGTPTLFILATGVQVPSGSPPSFGTFGSPLNALSEGPEFEPLEDDSLRSASLHFEPEADRVRMPPEHEVVVALV